MSPTARPALSLCMIVKNEENTLARCLNSVRELAPELVIADTGSTDATVRIASKYGAKIAAFDFTVVDFAAARNHALDRANGRWILALDADETLDAAGVPLIHDLMARGENAGYYFRRLNYHRGPAAPTTDRIVRLFPNRPAYRYRGRVHETVDASILAGGGRLLPSSICIHHDFSSDCEARRRRNLWYIEILNEEIAANPEDYSRLDFLAAEYHQLGLFDKATEVAERIARLRPLNPEAHLYAGAYHLLYRHDSRRASADFMEALRLRPGYPAAQSFLDSIDRQENGSGGYTSSNSTRLAAPN